MSSIKYDPYVMLLERIEQLEWSMEHLLGKSVRIVNGVRVNNSLMNKVSGSYTDHRCYIMQMVFPSFPKEALYKAAAVAFASNSGTHLVDTIARFHERRPKALQIKYTINDSIANYILECFVRFHAVMPALTNIVDMHLSTHVASNSCNTVATWLIRYANDTIGVSPDAFTRQILSGFSGSGFDVLSVTLYPIEPELFDSLLSFTKYVSELSNQFDKSNVSGFEGLDINDPADDPHSAAIETLKAIGTAVLKRVLPFFIDPSSDPCRSFLEACMHHGVSPGSFKQGQHHPCLMEDYAAILSMVGYYMNYGPDGFGGPIITVA